MVPYWEITRTRSEPTCHYCEVMCVKNTITFLYNALILFLFTLELWQNVNRFWLLLQHSPPQTRYTKPLPSAQDHTVTTSVLRESRFPPFSNTDEIRRQSPVVNPLLNITAAKDRHATAQQSQVAKPQKGTYCCLNIG